MPSAEHPAAELHALLAVAEQVAKQAASFDTETKEALADRLDRIRVHVMAEPDVARAQPAEQMVPMWQLRSHYYAGLILLPPTQQLETCATCQGQRVVGTGKK